MTGMPGIGPTIVTRRTGVVLQRQGASKGGPPVVWKADTLLPGRDQDGRFVTDDSYASGRVCAAAPGRREGTGESVYGRRTRWCRAVSGMTTFGPKIVVRRAAGGVAASSRREKDRRFVVWKTHVRLPDRCRDPRFRDRRY